MRDGEKEKGEEADLVSPWNEFKKNSIPAGGVINLLNVIIFSRNHFVCIESCVDMVIQTKDRICRRTMFSEFKMKIREG